MKKYKNRLLFSIFRVMLFLFLLSACALDSLSIKPIILLVVTGLWITVFIFINRDYFYTIEYSEVEVEHENH